MFFPRPPSPGRFVKVYLLAVALFATSMAYAQVGANLSGRVQDSSGAVLPNAGVKVTNIRNSETQTTVSNSDGEYRFVNLQPSDYKVEVSGTGFGSSVKVLNLLVGSNQELDFSLGTAGSAETITVDAGGDTTIATTASQPSAVIDNKQLAALPVLNRNFLAVAQTMPGAAPVAAQSVYTKWAVTKFGGPADQRNGYTTIVDGAPIDDSTFGSPVINISQDAIQEFKVYNHQFDAQYGRAMNAVVSVLTLSGGDGYHGTGYFFGRNAALNAQNALATLKPDYSLLRTGATVGGPVPFIAKTHVFGSYEYVRIHSAAILSLGASNPFASQQNGNYPFTQWESIGDVKVDHSFSQKHQIFGRYAYDHQFIPSGGPPNAAATTTDTSIAHSLVLEDTYVFSLKLVNTIHYEYLSHNLNTLPSNYDLGIVRPSYTFGQGPTIPQYYPRTNNGINDTVFLTQGKHNIKLGIQLSKVYSTFLSHFYEHGQFTFTTDKPFNINDSTTYPQSFQIQTPGNYFYRSLQWAGFVQDDFKMTPKLTINMGFRYDFNSNLRDNKFYSSLLNNSLFTGINQFVGNNRGNDFTGGLQPRLGAVYDVNGTGKLVIRGGFGMYYTRMRPYWALQSETQTFGAAARITDQTQLKNYPDITAVLGGKSLDAYVAAGGPRSAVTLADNFVLPYSMNFSLGVGVQISHNTMLNIDAIHDHSLHEVGIHDVNLPSTGAISTANPRPAAKFGQVGQLFNNGQARYDALEMQLRTRPSRYLETLQVSYAYSRSFVNSGVYYSTYQGTQRTPDNYSYNVTDTPHNLSVAMSSRRLPGGLRASTIFRGLSGSPFGVSAGIDLDGDANITGDRPRGLPQFIGRGDVDGQLALINAYRKCPQAYQYYAPTACGNPATGAGTTPVVVTRNMITPDNTLTWDMRISRPFQIGERVNIETFFEGFNISNHVTRYSPTSTMNSAAFMQRTLALDPRMLQYGVRVRY